MEKSSATLALTACAALFIGGCSGGLTNPLTTQSIPATTQNTVAAVPKTDPACYSLAQRIDTLRSGGLTERLEKASTGKSSNVSVKRTSLQQAAELDRANAEFQAKCSTIPRPAAAPQAAAAQPVSNSSQVVSATAPPVVQQR